MTTHAPDGIKKSAPPPPQIIRRCIRGRDHGPARPGARTCVACGDERAKLDRAKYQRVTKGRAGTYNCRKCGNPGHNARRCTSDVDLRKPKAPLRRGMIFVSACAALLVPPHASTPARCAHVRQDRGACAVNRVAPR